MNRLKRQTYMIGLISQTLAFSTMFGIASGLFKSGTSLIPWFFLTAFLLLILTWRSHRHANQTRRRTCFLIGILVIGLVAGGIYYFQVNRQVLLLGLFFLSGMLLMQRMMVMIDSVSFLHEDLLGQLRLDIGMIVALSIITLIFEGDSDWQSKVLPLFFTFLSTRLISLSSASRLKRGVPVNESQKDQRIQNGTAWGVVIAFVCGGWIFHSLGLPIGQQLMKGFMYVFDRFMVAFAMIMNYIFNLLHIHLKFRYQFDPDGTDGSGTGQHQPLEDYIFHFDGSVLNWIASTLSGIVIIALILVSLKRIRHTRAKINPVFLEVREFIREKRPTVHQRRSHQGSLSKMRKLYRRFLTATSKAGYVRNEGNTALEHIHGIGLQHPDKYERMKELTHYYMLERYGEKAVHDHQAEVDQIHSELMSYFKQ